MVKDELLPSNEIGFDILGPEKGLNVDGALLKCKRVLNQMRAGRCL